MTLNVFTLAFTPFSYMLSACSNMLRGFTAMAYQKILVDNLICKRRFHLSYDDAAKTQEEVDVRCLHCRASLFKRKNHPPVRMLREENLIATTNLSPLQATSCNFASLSKG